MNAWPDPFGRPPAQRTPPESAVAAEPRTRFVIVRAKDQKAWAGPWVAGGLWFTSDESKWYTFDTYDDAAYATICITLPCAFTIEEYTVS